MKIDRRNQLKRFTKQLLYTYEKLKIDDDGADMGYKIQIRGTTALILFYSELRNSNTATKQKSLS